MKQIALFAAVAALAFASQARAGCSEYTDTATAPPVTVCIDGKCQDTTVEYSCGNATSFYIGYATGLHIRDTIDGQVSILLNGKPVDPDSLSCKIDGEPSNCLAGG